MKLFPATDPQLKIGHWMTSVAPNAIGGFETSQLQKEEVKLQDYTSDLPSLEVYNNK